jgi:hypothetical protein
VQAVQPFVCVRWRGPSCAVFGAYSMCGRGWGWRVCRCVCVKVCSGVSVCFVWCGFGVVYEWCICLNWVRGKKCIFSFFLFFMSMLLWSEESVILWCF